MASSSSLSSSTSATIEALRGKAISPTNPPTEEDSPLISLTHSDNNNSGRLSNVKAGEADELNDNKSSNSEKSVGSGCGGKSNDGGDSKICNATKGGGNNKKDNNNGSNNKTSTNENNNTNVTNNNRLVEAASKTRPRYSTDLTGKEQKLAQAWMLIKHEQTWVNLIIPKEAIEAVEEKKVHFRCISAETKKPAIIARADIEAALRCIRDDMEYIPRGRQYDTISVDFKSEALAVKHSLTPCKISKSIM
ncbi:Hypothetical predicted protein [Octopus vulgaris]|uniref:Uncharacterized protein n=1 Tax=Octopus vulgaris TaxID=6645 RepID=A0AA36FKK1_OCTVU|nr:Hypothetical predicted protein [Octopus vulgaris]